MESEAREVASLGFSLSLRGELRTLPASKPECPAPGHNFPSVSASSLLYVLPFLLDMVRVSDDSAKCVQGKGKESAQAL